jgi:hypothetical protein
LLGATLLVTTGEELALVFVSAVLELPWSTNSQTPASRTTTTRAI